uniref:Hydroxymethylglutaryl-CoA synthase n=1 Tax=Arcella intermedia TaxID=1963864 RepID=A0A6B2L453_9EUKA
METYDGAPKGKYSTGLGQVNMAVVSDREDIVSISLTAVMNFFEKYDISPNDIGRLEVGTETIIDKSKSVKSYLMELFNKSGNFNIEGIDTVNACYGGTNALFNAINWIESSSWDGRYALVVAADIAVYAVGPARPTGGCSAVAMLIGPNAPLVIEPGIRGSHMEHVYDFYKPILNSEYPLVDGQLSIQCYLKALDKCYDAYGEKFRERHGKVFSLKEVDYLVFHSPYNKLVRKAYGRLLFNEFLRFPEEPLFKDVQRYKHQQREDTYFNRSINTEFEKLSVDGYNKRVAPSTKLSLELGNCYSASLYIGLLSLLDHLSDDLIGKRVLMFSYGSGMAASFFSIVVKGSIEFIKQKEKLTKRLSQRKFVEPREFAKTMLLREKHLLASAYVPEGTLDLFPGTFYLDKVDDKYRRYYKRKLKEKENHPQTTPAKL